MSFHVAYVSESAPPTDGAHIASTSGYHDFGTWVEQHAREYPETAHLVAEGWLDEGQPGSLAALDAELPRIEQAAAGTDVASVAAHLAQAVRARPAHAVGLLVTDGEEGEGDLTPGDEGDY